MTAVIGMEGGGEGVVRLLYFFHQHLAQRNDQHLASEMRLVNVYHATFSDQNRGFTTGI